MKGRVFVLFMFLNTCMIGIMHSFPYLEDENTNWGIVFDDKDRVPIDDESVYRRSIALDPIEPAEDETVWV